MSIRNYPTHQCIKMLQKHKFCFSFQIFKLVRFSKSETMFLPFCYKFVKALNTLFLERHNGTKVSMAVKMSRRTQDVEIHLTKKTIGSGFVWYGQSCILGSKVDDGFGVMWGRYGLQEPKYAYDIVRKRSLMIYTELIECIIVGDTKAPLLHCSRVIS